MKIEGSKPTQTPKAVFDSAKSTSRSGGSQPVRDTSTSVIDLQSKAELTRMLSESTQVRDDAVRSLRLQVKSGEYLEQSSAKETARSILNL